ncbi:LysE family translocator [Georgenia yuyongxinii]|uniref:LysE family translocator n=1 Tax=Georgenia yuyongxinii TaxID=2589797 RepID=A0A5B8C6M1_9MICO|nr:LysE family translocator [Georgenia yuyongxinii]QDC23576.1 LysE family translocator [Georgenia yuyongxinii]
MEPAALAMFSGIAAAMVAVPGPDWVFVLAAGTRNRVVLPAVTGLMIGYALITTAVALGVGPVVAAQPVILTTLSIAGAGYLAYLGIGILRSARTAAPAGAAAHDTPCWGAFIRRGIGVTALNPKALLLFLAILPQFARPSAPWPMPAQLAVLGAVFIAFAAVFYTMLGYLADRVFGPRPRLNAIISRVAGIAMLAVGALMLGEQAIHAWPGNA